ncbi:unnamed protein product [Rotaria sp. Silwood2]|nr:unnamed protein product [Rotaria sp. Silwood2]CAF2533271.1 unnamed protein product [Rotaria sp. Silwood2]CAF2785809.1 unnamed protein product [Rotaria sp. Silwood2]CAF2930395.1 unnamed protein product [Rotaria sp. Silwood2]CAF3857027.1 unnamed protein product [Rotaria sp. Silwood2]
MATEHYRPSSKSTYSRFSPIQYPTLSKFQSSIPINPLQINSTKHQKPIIKDLRRVNLFDELYPVQKNKTRIQETVEVIPQPVSCERIFYSYTNDHTELRSRESIKLDQDISKRSNNNLMKLFHNNEYDKRFNINIYSTTLFIFPKQRNEKFITEIRYIPEHITIRYKTTLELLAATLTSSNHERYYQNIQDFYHIAKDIFYRI